MSDAKLAANRANAKKSTGPRTDAGKRRSAMNAVRHGLCARTVCVHGEQSDAFNALVAEFVRDHQPISSTEYSLVYRLAIASWNLRRLTEAETSLIDTSTYHRAFEHGQWVERRLPIGEAMLKAMKDDKRFNALQLYQQRLERAFYRALGELRQLRKDRADRVDQDVDVGGEDEVRIEKMMSDRAPDEAIVEVPKAQAMPERSLAGESAGEPEPGRGSDEAPGAETEVETENEQTKPTPVSQVVLNADVAPSQVGANEPTAGSVPALYELDMLASNMRRLRRGLPVRYPQVA